ncbi:MAG: ABC transporter substrate-binding protein [Thermoleophilia bacterium]
MRQKSILSRGRIGRFIAVVAVLTFIVALSVAGSGCGDSTSPDSTTGTGTLQTGGILKIGAQPGNANFDPALFAGAVPDIQLQAQVYEKLVTLGADFTVQPALATEWSSADGKVWVFKLRDGVTFSNGKAFTADDVVYTMDRLRSKELGSPMADVYSNIVSVEATDPATVTFTLESVDAEFPASLTDYRTLMLCKDVADPAKEMVGTGPFVLESISAEDRAILKKNPSYWGTDAEGNKLPYLDEVDFIYSPDIAGQVEGLQGGTLNWVGGLTAEQKQTVETNTSLKTVSTPTNYCFELQIRTDQKPGSDLRVRQAIMAGTDRQAIIDLVAPGLAEPGNGTLVGPAYAADYLDTSVAYDPEKAKQLLADAGYASGLEIKLVAQTADPVPAIATAWQAQMKSIGVDVSIQQVPVDVYYADKGTDNWYQAAFSIVDYGTRAVPNAYFQLALTSTAPWNYSRWKEPQFDTLSQQISTELDAAKRSDLYKQAQQILQDQVPMMNFLVNTAVAGQTATIDGIALAPDWPQTLMRDAHYTQ